MGLLDLDFGTFTAGISQVEPPDQAQSPDQAHSKGSCCPAVCDGPHSSYLPELTGVLGACCPIWATGLPAARNTASTCSILLRCCWPVWALRSPTRHIRGPGRPEVGSSAEKSSSLIPCMLHTVGWPQILRNQGQSPYRGAGLRHLGP